MTSLRSAIQAPGTVLVPGVYDAISAKVAEGAGFPAVAISGYSLEASLMGLPDLGFTGLSDVESAAARIASSVKIPVICDADTGYGGPINVWDSVRRLEQAGVQAVHIEDQSLPKRCGGLPGRTVVGAEEMTAKIRAALDARSSDEFLIIARTDAKEALGVKEAIGRLNEYLHAGADVAFAAEQYSSDELRELGTHVDGPLAICAGIPGWPAQFESARTYGEWGIKLVLYPFSSLFPALRAMQRFYGRMADDEGVSQDAADKFLLGFDEFSEFIGVDEWVHRDRVARQGVE